MSTDLLVLGSGPAGLNVAAAAAAVGLRVEVLAPDVDGPWRPTWGAWVDSLPPEVLPAVAATWPTLEVHTGLGAPVVLTRPYARFDSAALRNLCRDRCTAHQVGFRRGAARTVIHGPRGSVVTDDAGREHAAAVVIDASGRGTLLERTGAPTAFQTAWGVLATVDGWSGPARWMDFTPVPGEDGPPTFLYALPMPDGRVFLEETSLVRRPGLPAVELERRLRRRLSTMELRLREVHEVETCVIPMNTPLPVLPQRVVGFGAAAAMIHPSTGYLLARALQTAPAVAEAIRDGLSESPERASQAAWQRIWPPERIRSRKLHALGAHLVAGLDAYDTRRFFAAFFSLPASTRDAWLDDTLPFVSLGTGMATLFRRLPVRVQWRLLAAGNPFRSSTQSLSEA